MKIRKVASTLMLWLVLIPGEGSAQSREFKTVRVAIIGGQVPLPIAIGQAHGFFEKFGVRVTAETMWTSQELRDGLASGKYDVAHAAVDNSVATAEINGVPIPCRLGVLQCVMRERAVLYPKHTCNPHQNQQRQVCSNAARVLQPLADVQPNDIQNHGDSQ